MQVLPKRWLFGLLFLGGCWGQGNSPSSPPWQDTVYLKGLLQLDTVYPFYELAHDTLFLAAHLNRTWERLRTGQKVRVLHIGDSHLQGDVQGREIRRTLYRIWGPGGRGYVFPYAIASTSSAYDYIALGQGQWLYARSVHQPPALPLGMTGMAIGTYDPMATWRVQWSPDYQPIRATSMGLLVRTLQPEIHLKLSYQDSLSPLSTTLPMGYHLSWLTTAGPIRFLEGRFTWEAADSLGYAELHGVFLEDTGKVTYYTMGVNGAKLSDFPALPLLKESLRLLAPHLVVLDLGTNDLYGLTGGLSAHKAALEAAIDTIRQALPEVDIVITTPQSFYRRMRPVSELRGASQIARWVAVHKQVALWDAASILGDIKSWRLAGLAHPDMVHLLSPGYAHKGQLWVRAFLHGYLKSLTGALTPPAEEGRTATLPDSLLLSRTIAPTPLLSQFGGEARTTSPQSYVPPKPTFLYHKVRPGETLGSIAQRYRVSVRAIQSANGLRGTTIRVGQMLRIPSYQGGGVTDSASKPPTPPVAGAPRGRYHTVRPGDSLWSIAQQYKTTVEALRKANGLSANQAIHPGQRLLIP